jgi:hypothetical protein
MVKIRTVRYAKAIGRPPLRELCDNFAGAGDRILAAASQPSATRDRAFRQLDEEWIAGSPYLAGEFARFLPKDHWVLRGATTAPARPEAVGPPAEAQLTLAGYTAAHTARGRAVDASAVINFAVPDDDGRWALRADAFPRTAHLSLDIDAFAGAGSVSGTPTSLALGGGAFSVAWDGARS